MDTSHVDRLVSTAFSYPLSSHPEGPCVDHSAISHQQGASYDPYNNDPFTPSNPPAPVPSHSPPIPQQPNPYSDPYSSGGNQYLANPHDGPQNPYTQGTGQGPQRAYTLGGSGYGDNVVPDSQVSPGYIPNPHAESYGNQPTMRTTSPTQMYSGAYQPTPVQSPGPMQAPKRPPGAGGPLPQRQPTLVNMTPDNDGYGPGPAHDSGQYADNPPTYDEHEPRPAGVWSTKS